MKYGVYFAYWESSWDVNFEKYVHKVKKLGFDILEVAALGLVNLPDEKLERLKQLAEQHNVILTAGIGLPKKYDVSSSDATVRRNGIAFMKKVMDAMYQAGIDRVGGTVYSYWPADYSHPFDKPTARKHSIESVKELAEYARQYDITLLIETLNRFEQFLLNDAEEAVSYVKEVDEPNVKVMLDTFHMNIEEDNIADAIRYTGDHLGHLHIGEANRKVPGKGSMPWKEDRAGTEGHSLQRLRRHGTVRQNRRTSRPGHQSLARPVGECDRGAAGPGTGGVVGVCEKRVWRAVTNPE